MGRRIMITIRADGAAFEDASSSEVARILRELAADFELDGCPAPRLRDINGNCCGEVIFAPHSRKRGRAS